MNALGLETPSSAAWRIAKSEGLTLGEFVELVLRLDWWAAHGDLDYVLGRFTLRDAAYAPLNAAAATLQYVTKGILRKTRDSRTRGHTKRVFFCPDCLRTGSGAACWSWRSRVVTCCSVHRRYLVGECGECGEIFRYRVGPTRAGSQHWLDSWSYCPGCGTETQAGAVAPCWLTEVALCFEQQTDTAEDLQQLASKIVDHISSQPTLLERCAIALGLPSSCDTAAGVGSAIVFAHLRGILGGVGPISRELSYFALMGKALSAALPAALSDLVNCNRPTT